MLILTLLFSVVMRPGFAPVGPAEVAAYERILDTPDRTGSAGGCVAVDVVPGQFVVGCRPGQLESVAGLARQAGIEVVRVDTGLEFVLVRAGSEDGLARSLFGISASVAAVRYIEPDCVVRASRFPDDPMFRQYQWDKWVMYADLAWDVLSGATGIKVAVVDNGVEYSHPDLAAAFVPGNLGYDFVGNDDDPRPDQPNLPEAFHGTHVSGIIAAGIDNRIGVAGWAQIQVLGVKVLSDSGTGNTSSLASGIRWAADNGARVINMSLGGASAPTVLVDACQYAVARNVLLIAASGNEGAQSVNYPAALNECAAVGALDRHSIAADFSNRGAQLELTAPGVDVVSTAPGGNFVSASGTSMATPEVTGVAALLFVHDPTLTASEVRGLLAASSIDLGTAGRDVTYGYGLVNARRALDLAAAVRAQTVRAPDGPVRRARALGTVKVPAWAASAAVIDCSGRAVARGGAGKELGAGLPAGVYAVRFAAAGKSEVGSLVRVR